VSSISEKSLRPFHGLKRQLPSSASLVSGCRWVYLMESCSLTPTGAKGISMSGINDYIDSEVKGNDVVLFMKGTPGFPQCGFSGQVVQILDYLGVDYKGVNVLTSNELRQGIKEYSNWPTIPQLYVKGEFVGGCDIIREMFQAGELQTLLEEKGVAAKAA
jgi:monothiol glutaredoxin